jgi:hypothetical protein
MVIRLTGLVGAGARWWTIPAKVTSEMTSGLGAAWRRTVVGLGFGAELSNFLGVLATGSPTLTFARDDADNNNFYHKGVVVRRFF